MIGVMHDGRLAQGMRVIRRVPVLLKTYVEMPSCANSFSAKIVERLASKIFINEFAIVEVGNHPLSGIDGVWRRPQSAKSMPIITMMRFNI